MRIKTAVKKLTRKPYLLLLKYTVGRPTQEVLNMVLDKTPYSHDRGMCASLYSAHFDQKTITQKEFLSTKSTIMEYVSSLSGNSMFLTDALELRGLPYDRRACLLIYIDWKNRPLPSR